MKLIRHIFTIILTLLLLVFGGVEVLAMNTGFSTESLPEDDMNTLLKNVNISMLTDEPPKKTIECFAVNEDGVIAIGCNSSENKVVCIYTSDGVFQYGYSFKCSGNFGIEFDKSVLNIYLVRSDIAIAVNSVGEVESILKIQNTSENNSYWNDCVFSTRRKIGDTEYFLKNDMGILNVFASSYSQLIITNKYGEESIIYDVNSAQFSNMVVVVGGVIVFICLVVAVVIWQFIKLKRNA
ncbi:MAG: hypothetical protein E7591_02650 [Ruminococcaceae bacterium]|nr:hypothetical protein [Oscillospiraceae bacterium]